MYSVFLGGFVSKLKAMQFAGTFNVYGSLRLAADTALRPGGWQGARRGLFSDNISFDSPV